MAHKGRLWEVAQFARSWSGQHHWPDYPPKAWIFRCEGWSGSALHPSETEDIELFFAGRESDSEVRWLSNDLGPAGQETIMGFKIIIPDGFSHEIKIRPLCYVDGSDQFNPLWEFIEPSTFEHFGMATDAGVMKTGWILKPGFFIHFNAKPY